MSERRLVLAALAALGASSAEAQQSNAAAYLLDEQIAQACDGAGGRIEPAGLIERDLTGDGRDDLLIAHEMIGCDGGRRSGFCGMQVCSTLIYVREGELLVLVEDVLGGGITVGPTDVPVISGYAHGGDPWAIRWDGSRFR